MIRTVAMAVLLAAALTATVPGARCAFADDTEAAAEGHAGQDAERLPHRVAFFTGNTLVPDGETRSGALVVPTFGLDYQYRFAERWAAMASFEIELLNYRVETRDGVFIDRDTPVVLAALAVYEAAPKLGLIAGGGIELEHKESLWLARLGGEYTIPIQNNWDVAFALFGDIKEEFWAVTFGIAFGKRK